MFLSGFLYAFLKDSSKGSSRDLLGGLSKSVKSRVLIGVYPFGVLLTLLISYLLSLLGLQVNHNPPL